MSRRLESLAFYLSANERVVDGEGSGVVSGCNSESADRHGPPWDASVAGRALVIACGRESDSGSAALFETLLDAIHGQAPALVVLDRTDARAALTAIVAEELLSRSTPMVVLDAARFAMARSAHVITLHRGGRLVLSGPRLAGIASVTGGGELGHEAAPTTAANDGFSLSREDQRDLDGAAGPAVQTALRIVLRMARLQGAAALVDVAQVSIDDRFQIGPAGLAVVERLVEWGGRVRVPTMISETTTPTSFDRACRALGATPSENSAPARDSKLERAPAPLAWPLALCMAISGRAPAPPSA